VRDSKFAWRTGAQDDVTGTKHPLATVSVSMVKRVETQMRGCKSQ